MTPFFFFILAGIAVFCAVSLVAQTHPISSALSLIGVMGSLAVLYLQLGAEFLAAAQLIVYAGAIMVLFVFVIMLLNAGTEPRPRSRSYAKIFGIPALVIFLGLIGYVVQAYSPPTEGVQFGKFTGGSAERIGMKLFTDYLLPFEIVSVLILIA